MKTQGKRRIETLVQGLCEEVDYWKEEAEKWEEKYIEARGQIIEMGQQSIRSTYDLTASVLTGILAASNEQHPQDKTNNIP